ncbi:tryptophan--tRNA ligase [Candidatus Woesearchaeota archaeon]|nr:tryptophan--tRNA ligase [Candidatus Woesearchaeota archaeon]
MKKIIDPWGAGLPEDYERIVKDFGLEPYRNDLPEENRLMRRGIVFAGRDIAAIAGAIKKKKPFYVLSGIMPSGEKIHLGNKMVVENIAYFQKMGGKAYILVADLEAASARGISLEEAKKRALNFHIPAYVALGLDPKKTTFYFQSENKKVIHMAYEFAKKITLNEFEAIYGSADPGRILSAITQVGDILYPQLEKPMPGVIPVGVDQDPHIRLTRDVVRRTQSKYKFVLPSSLYHKYTPSLKGGLKMSKSEQGSYIELPEDPKSACKKIQRALTGGRKTLEEQKRLGAEIEKDMVFELMKQHLVEDDAELQRIHDDYKGGRMSSGELKALACEKMTDFLEDFKSRLDKARKNIEELNFVKFS